jgi:hypothetical protein
MSSDFVDITVRTANPDALDKTLAQLPMCVARVIDGSHNGDTCTVRCFENPGFVKYAIAHQGYGEIVEP